MMPRVCEAERGIAIVSALWGSAIIAVIVLSVLQLVRSDAMIGRSRLDVATLTAAADGAINLTILDMLGPAGVQPPVDATPVTIPFAGHEVRVSVRDEAGRIDVNVANAATLQRVLLSVGAEPNAARELAQRMVAWRQPPATGDGGTRTVAGARHAPFQSVEELQLVPGMTRALYNGVEPLLTVYSHASSIDVGVSAMGVLNVFRTLDSGADAAYRRLDEVRLGLREPSPSQGVVLGHAFTIRAEVFGAASARLVRTAVIRLTGQQQVPLLIYRWG